MALRNALSKLLPAKSSKVPGSPGTVKYAAEQVKSSLISAVGAPIKNTIAAVRTDPGGAAAFVSAGTIPAAQKASALATKVVKSASSSFAAASTTAKVGVIAAAPVGAAILSDKEATKAIKNYPKDAFNYTSNIIAFAKDPTKESLAKVGTENPVLSAATLTAAAVGIGAAGATVVSGVLNRAATNDNTRALEKGNDLLNSAISGPKATQTEKLLPAEPAVTGPTFSPAPAPQAPAPVTPEKPKEASVTNNVRQTNYYAVSNQDVRIEKYKYKRRRSVRYGR